MMNIKNAFFIICGVLATVAFACSNDSVSMSYSPEQAVNDFYQSINDHDCEKNISLRSSNDQLIVGKEHDDSVKACRKLIYDGAPMVTASNIEVVSNDGSRAELKYQLTFSNDNIDKTFIGIALLVVEDDEWKVDDIQSKGELKVDSQKGNTLST